jgi:transcriptional regulator with XRE-family HTH domain
VQKYERGFNRIASSTLVAISQALNVSPSDLLQAPLSSGRPRTATLAEISRVASKLNADGRARLLEAAMQLAAKQEFKS